MKVQSRRSFVVACALALLLIFGWTAVSVGADSVACARRHTVQPGENLTSIAVFYGMTVEQLLDLNTIVNPDLIRVGISLCVSTILPTAESPRSISTDPKLPDAGQTSNQSVALSIDYIRRTDAADSVEFGTKSGLVGLRRLYPLESQGLEIFENSAGLLTALGDQPVVFYGIQWAGKGYALIEPAVTLSVLRPPLSGCPTPLRLGDEGILPNSAQLTVETQNEPNIGLGHRFGQPVLIGLNQHGLGWRRWSLLGRSAGQIDMGQQIVKQVERLCIEEPLGRGRTIGSCDEIVMHGC